MVVEDDGAERLGQDVEAGQRTHGHFDDSADGVALASSLYAKDRHRIAAVEVEGYATPWLGRDRAQQPELRRRPCFAQHDRVCGNRRRGRAVFAG